MFETATMLDGGVNRGIISVGMTRGISELYGAMARAFFGGT